MNRVSHRSRGFTLIEALVALVVLSIGLLGLASLQLTGLRWNHSASMRSQATILAYDIIDRMRANRNAAALDAYKIAVGAEPTAGTVAGDDLVAWKKNLANSLPSGDGSVASAVVGTERIYTVTIQWDDSHGAADPFTFSMETQL